MAEINDTNYVQEHNLHFIRRNKGEPENCEGMDILKPDEPSDEICDHSKTL